MRTSSQAIKSVHRQQDEQVAAQLEQAAQLVEEMIDALAACPELRYGGFVRDAQKEYVEAAITIAAIRDEPLPGREELGVDPDAWINGVAEAIGEFRRHALDCIRRDDIDRAEQFLGMMEEFYHVIMGFDYPKAISGGLRSRSDAARGMVERTRGDVTNALRQRRLEERLAMLEEDD